MIELTEKQGKEIGASAGPIRVLDPASKREYVLVSADVFSRFQAALADIDPREAYPAIDRAFAPGWDDPKMSDYDHYEQHKR